MKTRTPDSASRRNRMALLLALGIDNFGSGLFLPLPVVYATRIAGLPIGEAGAIITIGTTAGLAIPPIAGRFVDRFGPRAVVICAQFVQAAAALAYFAAEGPLLVLIGAVLLAAGQQAFYSSLFALIGDTAGPGPKDHTFALAGMVRSAAFGLGGLCVGALLAGAGPSGFRLAVAADAISFLAAGALLLTMLRLPHTCHRSGHASLNVLRNRPYLALIVVSALFGLAVDFFLVGIPVYVLETLRGPSWLPGAMVALVTAVGCLAATSAVRATRRLSRTTAMACGAALAVLWCLASGVAVWVPPESRPVFLLATTVLIAASNLMGARANALAEAAAPRPLRGRYLAAFQYAFTAAGVAAPGIVALFSVASWLPWLIVGACGAVAGIALVPLSRYLPVHAVNGHTAPMMIRPATPADADAIGEIHVRSWQAAYAGLVPAAYLDGMSVPSRQSYWRNRLDGTDARAAGSATFVAENGDTVIGFGACGPSHDRDADGHLGALYVLSLHPAHWRGGTGTLLHDRIITALRAAGHERATLWVLDGNTAARTFYEKQGWTWDGTVRTEPIGDSPPLTEVRYTRAL
ncbi:MFS transporter [Amycolatopsis minnesotensis]|uniref:MFS transporter n=1 Tax=Amycolatopsis minnesotensis TaxID=337894 RepID=UPI0031E29B46